MKVMKFKDSVPLRNQNSPKQVYTDCKECNTGFTAMSHLIRRISMTESVFKFNLYEN